MGNTKIDAAIPNDFGGVRYWFVCPGCGRRMGTLYLAGSSTTFLCRQCSNLTYESRNEPHWARYSGWERLMILNIKAGQLRRKVKRRTYAGGLTKKARRLRRIERLLDNIPRWSKPCPL